MNLDAKKLNAELRMPKAEDLISVCFFISRAIEDRNTKIITKTVKIVNFKSL